MDLNELMNSEEIHLKRLRELVEGSLHEEQLLSHRLFEIETDKSLTLGQKAADHLASFGGSWKFILCFSGLMVIWIAANAFWLRTSPFDPYPFILLNLVLSCLAALQAPVIMMSQNRQEEKDRRRARGDYLVNMKAEMEIRSLHAKMDLLIAEQMHSLFEIQKRQMALLERIDHALRERPTEREEKTRRD